MFKNSWVQIVLLFCSEQNGYCICTALVSWDFANYPEEIALCYLCDRLLKLHVPIFCGFLLCFSENVVCFSDVIIFVDVLVLALFVL
uniref:Putative secreted peptide n=1 Tax=Anopheles braziliensis TaxID=58242 RepID=A0A2M3ZSK6_9DIPT